MFILWCSITPVCYTGAVWSDIEQGSVLCKFKLFSLLQNQAACCLFKMCRAH